MTPSSRRLSGWMTPVAKFVVAPAWIIGFGTGVVLMWLDPQGLVAADPHAASGRWWMSVLFIAGTGFLYWSGISAKLVRLTDTGLLVSNFLVEETVLFSDIIDVSQFTWAHPRMVTLRFRRRIRFGDAIRFLPRFNPLSIPFKDDAVVEELRVLSRSGTP